jgi:hypothetical protein
VKCIVSNKQDDSTTQSKLPTPTDYWILPLRET